MLFAVTAQKRRKRYRVVLKPYPYRAGRIALLLIRRIRLLVFLVKNVYVLQVIQSVSVYVVYVGYGILIFRYSQYPVVYVFTRKLSGYICAIRRISVKMQMLVIFFVKRTGQSRLNHIPQVVFTAFKLHAGRRFDRICIDKITHYAIISGIRIIRLYAQAGAEIYRIVRIAA